ncbi:MAG: YraN family protein [Candidatus Paceibacterota bacterium]
MNNDLHNRQKGNLGEDIACKYIENLGFTVSERNFQRKWGELDIIAEKDNIVHFFEVKSVTNTLSGQFFDSHKPEENVDSWKTKHLRRIIETYLGYSSRGLDANFQVHVLSVYMNMQSRKAKVRWLKNVIL